ncbi:hypothetical protein [Streptomyces chiangmaiensis]|uniref:Uncharacterized protein n=1 Tax=Streptomyces chiangmaiensis TaxID=766497 RepID=A0ABU7FLH4_9ACTN|nr:hypothetical protein [Streptomyces chiangmaiensis]MED7824542.1 hypothetical protein [Streptomyces chiangmaiensis]
MIRPGVRPTAPSLTESCPKREEAHPASQVFLSVGFSIKGVEPGYIL